jgi:hypothetical protein
MVKGDFLVRPGWEPMVGDEVIDVSDAHASSFEEFTLVFGLQRHLVAKDGVDNFCGSDILMMRISVLFIIVIITILSLYVVMSLCGIVGSELLGVDVLEKATILHGVIGSGMKLAGTF